MHSRGTSETLCPLLAELALHSKNQESFRDAWLSHVAPALGFDSGAVFSSNDGQAYATRVFQGPPLDRDVAGYIAELEPHELSLAMVDRTILDDEVFCAKRRDALRVYREYCAPHGTVRSAMRAWMRDGKVFFIFLSKKRGTKTIQAQDMQALDALFPVIALGEALHARERVRRHSVQDLGAISAAESTVVSLAQRGLTNVEISRITGTRPVTVRNQLSSAYRKLGVTNRTELTFLLSGIDADVRSVRGMSVSAIEDLLKRASSSI